MSLIYSPVTTAVRFLQTAFSFYVFSFTAKYKNRIIKQVELEITKKTLDNVAEVFLQTF